MSIDKLNDIVNEYNNTYHRTITMKPVDVENNTYIDSSKKINDKDRKYQVGDQVRISKCKIFLLKNTFQTGLRKFLWLNILKIQFLRQMLLIISMVKKLLEHFMKKKKQNYKRQINKNLA